MRWGDSADMLQNCISIDTIIYPFKSTENTTFHIKLYYFVLFGMALGVSKIESGLINVPAVPLPQHCHQATLGHSTGQPQDSAPGEALNL